MPASPPPESDQPTRAQTVFDECVRLLQGHGPSAPLREELHRARRRLGEPLRVAIAGQVSRGKSTLVNAMLGVDVVAVGRGETTDAVTELFHADRPRLTVRYEDGAAAEGEPADLHRFTVRGKESGGERRIERVELGLPADFLKAFRLLDTPGLASIHEEDALLTETALGLDGPDLDGVSLDGAASGSAARWHRESEDALETADALVFIFDSDVHEQDFAVVERFAAKSPGKVTPVYAIGVYAKCDVHWKPGGADPLEAFREVIAANHRSLPMLSRSFFDMVAVAGIVAHGAARLTPELLDALRKLAEADPRALAASLRFERRFVDDGAFAPGVDAEDRRVLLDALQAWGLSRACDHLREHPGAGIEELRAHLRSLSGVERLNRKLLQHFGNRASFIKLHAGLHRVRQQLAAVRRASSGPDRAILAVVEARLDELETEDSSLRELQALAEFYAADLGFTDAEREEVLRVTGEEGTRCEDRLGLPSTAALSEMEHEAELRAAHWGLRAESPALTAKARWVARIIARTYERIFNRVRQAHSILDIRE